LHPLTPISQSVIAHEVAWPGFQTSNCLYWRNLELLH
jgi:hypothetical protein